jgi:hypothetical protein
MAAAQMLDFFTMKPPWLTQGTPIAPGGNPPST